MITWHSLNRKGWIIGPVKFLPKLPTGHDKATLKIVSIYQDRKWVAHLGIFITSDYIYVVAHTT